MSSNVYLAQGTFNGQYVMKVGKANDVRQRQENLEIIIKTSRECPSERDAFTLEDNMRRLVLRLGAKRLRGRIDWFEFDADIYQQLEQFLTADLFAAPAEMYRKYTNLDDLEVEAIQERYQQILRKEREVAATPYALNRYSEMLITRKVNLEAALAETGADVADLKDEIDEIKRELKRFRAKWNLPDEAASGAASSVTESA